MSGIDMLNSGSVYAVPTQLVFKKWVDAAAHTTNAKSNQPSAKLTRTLLITHSSDDIQPFVLVPPSTGRFEVSVASSSSSNNPGVSTKSHPPNSLVPHLSKPKANFYALPPQATLTCTISFHASQDAAANYQDAVFIYTPHCVATPFLTIPLLAIARGDTAPTSTFVPTSLAAPPNPSPQLFNDYLSQRQQEEDEQRQQKAVQQQFKSNSRKATHAPDVFVVNDDDDNNDFNDEEMQSASDDGEELSAPGSRSSTANHNNNRPASRSASSTNQDLNLSALGQRIAAEAARADAEDDMADIAHSSTTSSTSSSSRTSLTTAGVLRTGLSARLHSSAGGRSGGAQPSSSRGRPPEIGQQQVYQPFQRPATAEQRHLTEALDSGFVISTESAIDALVEEDMEAEEEEEERKLLQSSQGRPSTAARYNSTQVVPTLNITPALLAEEAPAGKTAEEDEADFYQQILLTARSATAAATTTTPSSNSRPPRPTSVRRTTSGSSRNGVASASPPIDSDVQASSGLPRKLSSDAYQDQAAAPTTTSYRPRSSSSNSSSRPVSRSSPPASAAPLSAMMRSMQLGASGAAGEDWQERLAREQEIERRRHQNAATIPNSMRMQQDEQPSRPTVTRFPSLKK